MTTRGSLYRCHLFSFGGPQTQGILSRWTKYLEPINDRVVNSGELVELYVSIEDGIISLGEDARIRFDILEEDHLLTGGEDDKIVSFVGSGSEPGEEGFQIVRKETLYRRLGEAEAFEDAIQNYRIQHPFSFQDSVLFLERPSGTTRYVILTWWEANRLEDFADSEFYFIVNINGELDDQSETVIEVTERRVTLPEVGVGFYTEPQLLREAQARATEPGLLVADSVEIGESAEPRTPRRELRRVSHTSVQPAVEEQEIPEEERIPEWPWPHPFADVDSDHVETGSTPFDGTLIAIFPRWEAVQILGGRYIVSYQLQRAVSWGLLHFGASAFVILEGPIRKNDIHYLIIPTNYHITSPQGDPNSTSTVGGFEFSGVAATYWNGTYPGDDGLYVLRALITSDDYPVFPLNRLLAVEFYRELERLALTDEAGGQIPTERARQVALEALNMRDVEDAARRLAELDYHAFQHLNPTEKFRALEILLRAWTREPQELAVLEILKSIRDNDEQELREIVQRLESEDIRYLGIRFGNRFDQLFGDLANKQLYEMLALIGQKFGGERLTIAQIMGILRTSRHFNPALRLNVSATGLLLPADTLEELESIAEALWNFIIGSVEGIWMILSEPDKVIQGLAQLAKMLFYLYLATAPIPYPPAVEYLNQVFEAMKERALNILKGIEVLDRISSASVVDELVRDIKWAIILEVASWFIGVGEIRAGLSAISAALSATDFARIFRVLRIIDRAADLGRAEAKFRKLASILRRMADTGTEEDIIRLLSHLPEERIRDLYRAADRVNLDDINDLSGLTRRSADLAHETQQVSEMIETLRVLERRIKQIDPNLPLSDSLVRGYQRLASRSDLSSLELRAIITELPVEHAELYMRAIQRIPDDVLGEGVGRLSYNFLYNLSNNRRAMEFIIIEDYVLFRNIYRSAGRNFNRFEDSVSGLQILRRYHMENGLDINPLLEGLRANNPVSALALRDARDAYQFAAHLPVSEQVLVYRALIAETETGFERRLRELAERLRRYEADPQNIEAIIEQIRSRHRTRTQRVERAVAPDLETQRVAELDHPTLLVQELRGRIIERIDASDQRLIREWLEGLGDRELTLIESHSQALQARLAQFGVTSQTFEQFLIRLRSRTRNLPESLRTAAQEADPNPLIAAIAERIDRSRRTAEQRQLIDWFVELGQNPQRAEQFARELRQVVERTPALREIARNGGDAMLRRLWVQFNAPRPPSRQLTVGFEHYVDILTRHFRGMHGEYEVAFRISDRYIILKAPDARVTIPGHDLVVVPRRGGGPIFIDNKAMDVDQLERVNALTRNFPRNLDMDIEELALIVDAADVPEHVRLALELMRNAQREIAPLIQRVRERIAALRGLSGDDLERAVRHNVDLQREITNVLQRQGMRRVVTHDAGEVRDLAAELRVMGIELDQLNPARQASEAIEGINE